MFFRSYDVDRIVSDTTSSTRNLIKTIVDIMSNKELLSYEAILAQVKERIPGVNEKDFEEIIGKMNKTGDILESRNGYYQMI